MFCRRSVHHRSLYTGCRRSILDKQIWLLSSFTLVEADQRGTCITNLAGIAWMCDLHIWCDRKLFGAAPHLPLRILVVGDAVVCGTSQIWLTRKKNSDLQHVCWTWGSKDPTLQLWQHSPVLHNSVSNIDGRALEWNLLRLLAGKWWTTGKRLLHHSCLLRKHHHDEFVLGDAYRKFWTSKLDRSS